METKQGITPGPWKIDEADDLPLAVIEDTEYGDGICEIGERTPRNLAIARAIAAVPDLIAALAALTATARTFRNVPKDEQEWGPLDDEALDAAFAVLAKAQGETA